MVCVLAQMSHLQGSECQAAHMEAAVEAARLHAHYEAAAHPAEVVLQGGEPAELLRAFNVHSRPPVVPKVLYWALSPRQARGGG